MSLPARLPLTGLPVAGTGRRSALLASWATTWLAGQASTEAVLAAVTERDEPHLLEGGGELPDLLTTVREQGAAGLRLVLPVPGDPRGLPGPGPLTDAALTAGEAVLAQGCGLGAVPLVSVHGSQTDGFTTVVRWQVFSCPPGVPEPRGTVRQVEHDLTDAVREAATTLARLDVASLSPRAAARLAEVRDPRSTLRLPRTYPPAAHHLLAQAERLALVLEIAGEDDGAAVDAGSVRERREVLRSFAAAVRRARVAAVNAPLDESAGA